MDSRQQYRLIVDTAYEGIWVFDDQYVATFVNRRMAEMLGYKKEEILGKDYASFWFEEELPDLKERTRRRRQGLPEHYDGRLRRKDGTTLRVHVSATPMMGANGEFQGSFAMLTDVTESKEAEEALLRSEAKYRSIFENAVEGIFQSTPEGGLVTVNPAMSHIFGYASPGEMVSTVVNIGRQLYANTADRSAFVRLLENRGIAEGFEARFYRKDGSVLWGSLNVRAVKDNKDNLLFYEGTLVDITARKKAEEALVESEAKYRNIFENAVEGIFQITPDGKYISVNPSLARIHGFSSPEEMVESVTDIAHQLYVDPSRRAELMRVVKEEGFAKDFEIMMRRKDGGLQWVSLNSHGVLGSDGAVVCYEGTVQDITSRKFAEEELRKLRKTLDGMIHTMSAVVRWRDPGIGDHQGKVARLAGAIACGMGFSEDMIQRLETAALIHDIGKIAVPGEILNKPGGLTEAEYGLVKVHPQTGFDLLKGADLSYPVAEIVLQHHERLNGSGYPQGLKGSAILLEARILAVADVVEAMASSRPYRPAPGLKVALEEIKKGRGVYDGEVVKVCLKLFRDGRYQLD